MTTADQKLDIILEKLEKLEDIETKLDNFNKRLTAAENNFVTKCEKIEEKLDSKDETDLVEKLKEKITLLEAFISNYEINSLMQESYNKQLNVLIQGIKEDEERAWETREVTM